MAIVNLCTGTAAAAALLESLIIGKLGAVVYGYTLEYFIKVCAVCPLDTVKGFYNACGGVVFHNADNLVAGITLGQYEHSFFSAFLALYAIHFPMSESGTLRNLCGAFLYALTFGGASRSHFLIFAGALISLNG